MKALIFSAVTLFVASAVVLPVASFAKDQPYTCKVSKQKLVPPPSEDPYVDVAVTQFSTDKFGEGSGEFDGLRADVSVANGTNTVEVTVRRKPTAEEKAELEKGAFRGEPPASVVVASSIVSFRGPLSQAILSFGDYTVVCE